MRTHTLGFLAAVLFLASSTSGADNCTFEPNSSAGRVVAMRNIYKKLKLIADTAQVSYPFVAPLSNEQVYPQEMEQHSGKDTVWLKLLLHPTGIVLDAKLKKDGHYSGSHCFAYQWAAATQFTDAVQGEDPEPAWLLVDVQVAYDPDSIRVSTGTDVKPDELLTNVDEVIGRSLPRPGDLVSVETPAEAIRIGDAEYPEQEKQAGHSGVVWVQCLVGQDGRVLKTIVDQSCGFPALDTAALATGPRSYFKPAIQNGRPVAMWVKYKVEFN